MKSAYTFDQFHPGSRLDTHASRQAFPQQLPAGSWMAVLHPIRVLRDDLGRVAWIVTANNEWFGVRYSIMSDSNVMEIIEPYLIWRKEGIFFFAYHATLATPVLDDNQEHMSFCGKVHVNQQTGEIQILLQTAI